MKTGIKQKHKLIVRTEGKKYSHLGYNASLITKGSRVKPRGCRRVRLKGGA